jgi:flagellar motor switch protein FliN/FliY
MADSDVERELQGVADAAGEIADAASAAAGKRGGHTLDFILDVTLQVTVEVGRARMTIQDLLQLGQGSVVELEKLAGEPLDIFINGKQVARGEAVIVNEKFGVRLTDIISPEDRVEGLA